MKFQPVSDEDLLSIQKAHEAIVNLIVNEEKQIVGDYQQHIDDTAELLETVRVYFDFNFLRRGVYWLSFPIRTLISISMLMD